MERQKGKIRAQIHGGHNYVFIDFAVWNKEKKRGEHKRTYIGKIVNGNIEFNKNGLTLYPSKADKQRVKDELNLTEEAEPAVVPASADVQSQTTETADDVNSALPPGAEHEKASAAPKSLTECKRLFYGGTYLLDQIALQSGIKADLKTVFGSEDSSKILSLAYYLIVTEGRAMYRFPSWSRDYWSPYNGTITSQRISEFLQNITEGPKNHYLKRQAERHSGANFCAYDTTSISTYSENLELAKWGNNKEGDELKQVNLAVLCDESTMMPVTYRTLAGNTADAKTLINLVKDIDFLAIRKLRVTGDRAFLSRKNINYLMRYRHEFIIGAKLDLGLVSHYLEQARNVLPLRSTYNAELKTHMKRYVGEWDYEEEHPRLGKTFKEKREINVFLYFDEQKRSEDMAKFNSKLDMYETELRQGQRVKAHESEYRKYFTVTMKSNGIDVLPIDEAVLEATKNFGYFALVSDSVKNPEDALKIYRFRDVVEKNFNTLKDRLGMRRMGVSSDASFQGKLFVMFIALQILGYIKKHMDDAGLFKNFSIASFLDELGSIEYFKKPRRAHYLSEITEKQKRLYKLMEVDIPS